MNSLDIAILSDLHAFDDAQGKEDPSYLSVSLPDTEPGKHPITALKELIKTTKLSAQLVLCPGDIGDKARPAAIKYAWASLQELSKLLGSDHLVATTGNHDCDSRYAYNSFDAKGVLQSLAPPYPFSSEIENDRYWARNFATLEGSHYRLVVLNSSAYHGNGTEEFEHGRISDATIEQLRASLCKTANKAINILLCHHHPQSHSELGLGGADTMKNGQQLLDLLSTGEFGAWIVVHGHKHHPKLSYAAGGGARPVVFAAGSLSAILKPPLSSLVKNQFYVMSIPIERLDDYGLVGTIRSWEWVPGKGWIPSAPQSRLPSVCGFGYRTNPILMAKRIAKLVEERSRWADVCSQIPEIEYVIPDDFDVIRRQLRDSYQLGIVEDRDGVVREIGKLL
jgi:3',5'-cyclic AMP phosphodiesterase CpdA